MTAFITHEMNSVMLYFLVVVVSCFVCLRVSAYTLPKSQSTRCAIVFAVKNYKDGKGSKWKLDEVVGIGKSHQSTRQGSNDPWKEINAAQNIVPNYLQTEQTCDVTIVEIEKQIRDSNSQDFVLKESIASDSYAGKMLYHLCVLFTNFLKIACFNIL